MAKRSITKTVYYVHLPYPKDDTFRMVECHKQPFFFAKDVAKSLHLSAEKVLKLAVPHVSQVMHVKVISFYGYWRAVLFGDSHTNRTFQHTFIKYALNLLYKDYIRTYLELVQKSDNNGKSKHRTVKTKRTTFYE